MAFYPDEVIQQLKAHADISLIIQRFIPLKKSGTGRFVGRCPFHDDRSPSMNVNPQMGIYKCFACGAGGDVFKFVMDHEKIDFKSAIELVAQETGFPLPALDSKEDAGVQEERALVKTLNELACGWFQDQLATHRTPVEYLAKRGIRSDTQERFRFGYAPESREGFIAFAARKGFSPKQVVQAGLATERENGGIADKFRGRLMVPIQNLSGVVVGFGGRILDSNNPNAPKYMNSPETALYSKSDILFGLHHSRQAIAKSESVVLVEGYFDLISLFQEGVENVVAASGTALTDQHARILSRYAKTAYLVFDGDAAGKKATRRSLEVLLPHSLSTRVLLFGNDASTKVDPDSYVREQGADAFRKLLADAPDWLHFLSTEMPTSSTEERAAFINLAKGLIASIHDLELRDQYLRLLQERFSVSRSLYHTPPPGMRKPKLRHLPEQEADQSPAPQVPWQSLNGAELRFVTLVLKHAELWPVALRVFDPQSLESNLLAELLDHGFALFEEAGTINLTQLHSQLPPLLQELLEGLPDESWNPASAQKEFLESLIGLHLRHCERLRKAARSDLGLFMELNNWVRTLTDTLKKSQQSQITPDQSLAFLIPVPKQLKLLQQRTNFISHS